MEVCRGLNVVFGILMYTLFSDILIGNDVEVLFLNSDSGRVACRNNRSACPQKFNGFGWFPEIYLGLSLFI